MTPALTVGLLGLVMAVVLLIQGAALPTGPVAVVFPPGSSMLRMADAVDRAGGLLVRAGGLPGILVARSDHPGFADRLRRQGAWFVFDPLSAAGCLRIRPG